MLRHTEGAGDRQTVKAHLLESRSLLVESLYNLAPLLDCAVADGLLTQDNYYDVKAEKTPPKMARKLLEVVNCQMDENQATRFLECLRRCEQHYPRLRSWLNHHTESLQGPTEHRLQAQFRVLCARLGCGTLPISLALFSAGIVTQFELEQVQAAAISLQQAQKLLQICLSKGDGACKAFYKALEDEDQYLAEELSSTSHPDSICGQSVQCEHDASHCPVAVEETRDSFDANMPHSGDLKPDSDVLRQVMERLGVVSEDMAKLNCCQLGVVLGLPRWSVRGCLLEEEGIGDEAQLVALVTFYLKKTQDASRLLSRVMECNLERVQLSRRGCLLLKLLGEANAIIHTRSHHDALWAIFSFLMWDCVADIEEIPGSEPGQSAIGHVQRLRGNDRVDTTLLEELEECWIDGGVDSLEQSIRVLAQILRDLHPLQENLHLSPNMEGMYLCHPGRIQRVTCFQGLPARIIRKALGGSGVLNGAEHCDADSLSSQYRDLCLQMAKLLDRVCSFGSSADLQNEDEETIIQYIRSTLTKSAFRPEAFDAGVKHRLLGMLEYSPAELAISSVMELHQETLSELERYLCPGEQHSFQFVVDCVHMLGSAQLQFAARTRGPVAIDNGMEETYNFVTSEATSFLIKLHCCGYKKGQRFEVSDPQCVCLSQLDGAGLDEVLTVRGQVLAQEGGTVWVRDGGLGWKEKLRQVAQKHSGHLREERCCFKVISTKSECEVKFIFRNKIWATAMADCEVL
ncbi:uncharacterized protein LOC114784448 isoform X2 [Denticeps clupeoides]|uniref:uncharacterized protein LOC114784448 isoform X2 n=1 Tax=Denticeps clupeoides TaxID=299321 RepID=UPI0010A38B31|nr:uncharacterized protein LOC114784448 isoform X2 [Denticeps clupeoides]